MDKDRPKAPAAVGSGPDPAINDKVATEPTEVAEVSSSGEVKTATGPDVTAEVMDKFIGRVLANRYRINRRVGTGGFGAVFEAEDTKIRKRVAVKVLTKDLIADHAIVARFRQEAEAASKAGHENIVDITDFDRTVDGHHFMVMEYLEGVDLAKVIRAGEQLAVSRILTVMIQVCRALHSAHASGVVHRDLKPSNIVLTTRGSRADFVKLLDFGISKFMEVDDESSRLTKTGQIIGTPLYMAPEQACGEEGVDRRADIYSLGVIMYELVTGQPPFTAVNYLGIIAQHASEPPVPPTKVKPELGIPKTVEAIILRAMAKRPKDRFSTMVEMERAMVEALAGIDPAMAVSYTSDKTPPSLLTAPRGVPARPKGKNVVSIIVIVLAVVSAAGIYFAFMRDEGEQTVVIPLEDQGPGILARAPDLWIEAAEVVPDGGATIAPREVVLRITSSPPKATVFNESGEKLGVTPLRHKLPASARTVTFTLKRTGFKPATVVATPDKDRTLEATLKRRFRGPLPDDPKGWGQR